MTKREWCNCFFRVFYVAVVAFVAVKLNNPWVMLALVIIV